MHSTSVELNVTFFYAKYVGNRFNGSKIALFEIQDGGRRQLCFLSKRHFLKHCLIVRSMTYFSIKVDIKVVEQKTVQKLQSFFEIQAGGRRYFYFYYNVIFCATV